MILIFKPQVPHHVSSPRDLPKIPTLQKKTQSFTFPKLVILFQPEHRKKTRESHNLSKRSSNLMKFLVRYVPQHCESLPKISFQKDQDFTTTLASFGKNKESWGFRKIQDSWCSCKDWVRNHSSDVCTLHSTKILQKTQAKLQPRMIIENLSK